MLKRFICHNTTSTRCAQVKNTNNLQLSIVFFFIQLAIMQKPVYTFDYIAAIILRQVLPPGWIMVNIYGQV